GVGLSAFMFQGLLTTYSIAYGVQIGIERQTILNALSFSSFFAIFGIIGWSRLSDTIGRRPLVIAGAVLIAVWGFALFPMLETKNGLIITIGMVIGQGVIHPMIYGPLAGLYSELFDTEHRYTGASLGYQIAGIGAGISPVLFAAILNSTGSPSTIPLSIVILIVAAISIFCIWRLGETKSRTLSEQRFAETPAATGTAPATDTPPAAMEGPTP
ncbi:MAG: MFS transporter, partial [Brevibacterium aurantiacum]